MHSIQKVSKLLDIPAVTIRAWENRYKVVSPIRSTGGHRLYSESDIHTLKWLKNQITKHNKKIGEAVSLLQQQQRTAVNEVPAPPMHGRSCDLANTLYHHLIGIHSSCSHQTIDLAFSLYHFEHVFYHILAPVLVRLGEEWEQGIISTAQEHFSSQLIMQRIMHFFRVLPVYENQPTALAFCPEGEHHHIGLMLFSLFLRTKGIEVIYLGPNTPYDDLDRLIKDKRISIVAMSISDPDLVNNTERWLQNMILELPNLNIVLGGKAFYDCHSPLSSYVQASNKEDWEAWYQSSIGITHLHRSSSKP